LTTEPTDKALSPSGANTSVELAKNNALLNQLERELVDRFPAVQCPVQHRFTPGMYSREIFMPAGSLITSKIHRTEHQFVVLSGRCRVYNAENEEVAEFTAGHVGITKPGTRRVLVILEDTRWVTFHPTNKTDLAEIESDLIEPHDIPIAALEKSL
jgi:hypothetical protein